MRVAESLGLFFYGHGCLGCGKGGVALDPWLCPDCGHALQKLGNKPVLPDGGNTLCLYPMTDLTHRLVLALKYGGMRGLGRYLVEKSSAKDGEAALVLKAWGERLHFFPVPVHPARWRERGYNQCAGIAKTLQEMCGGVEQNSVLCRSVHKDSQTWLGRSERGRNVAGVFTLRHAETVRGQHCVVVDDVYTTGATTGSCCRVLESAAALSVHVCTLVFEMPVSTRQDWVADQQLGAWGEIKKLPEGSTVGSEGNVVSGNSAADEDVGKLPSVPAERRLR